MSNRLLTIGAIPADVRSVYNTKLTNGFSGALAVAASNIADVAITCDIVYGIETNPYTLSLDSHDGIIWTGSPLSVLDDSIEARRLGSWMKLCFASGNPIFGTCFGLQLAAKTAGG